MRLPRPIPGQHTSAHTDGRIDLALAMLCPDPTATARWAFPEPLQGPQARNVCGRWCRGRGGQWKHRTSPGVRTGPKGVSYDVDDDAGDAQVRHPGYCVLRGRNRVRSHLAKQRRPGWGTPGVWPPCSWQCHLLPPEDWREVGSRGGSGGRVWSPRAPPPHLQNQSDRQHAAGGEAGGEAQEEQDSPPQELHHDHLEGKRPRKGPEVQEPQGPPGPPLPGAAFAGNPWPVPHPASGGQP